MPQRKDKYQFSIWKLVIDVLIKEFLEETNRKIVDHIADINLTYSDIAREYLLKESLPADRFIKTGSPMFEVLDYYLPEIKKSKIHQNLKIKKGRVFLGFGTSREENINSVIKILKTSLKHLNIIAENYGFPEVLHFAILGQEI